MKKFFKFAIYLIIYISIVMILAIYFYKNEIGLI